MGSQTTNSAEASIKGIAAENSSGSTAATDMAFFTKPTGTGPGSSPTERMRITSDGKIGIGLNNPTSTGITIQSASSPGIKLVDTTQTNIAYLYAQDSNIFFGSGSSHPVVFGINNLEVARIATSGNVGINTSTTNNKLSIQSSDVAGVGTAIGS